MEADAYIHQLSLNERTVLSYEGNLQRSCIDIGPIYNRKKCTNYVLAYGTTTGDLKIYYDLFSPPIKSAFHQGPITAVTIGSVRNSGQNTLLVGSIDGQLALYHLEDLEGYFLPHSFKGKPKSLGIGNLHKEMEDFDAEFEKEFDPVLDFSEGNKKLQEEEDKSLKDSFLKVYDQRITPQINQRIQSNICLIKCKAAHLSSSKQDCIFVATTDGYLYLYTLECNPSEAKCNILSYNPETDSIELDNRPFMGNSAFHLVGLKTWQFSGQITKLSFTKIYNSFQGGFTRKAFKRSNSFHDSNYESNDTLICAGLVNNKVALFPLSSTRTNQTMNELSVNRSMSEVFILNIQVNVLVFILFK